MEIGLLLSDAEIPENIPQNLVGGDFAGDGAEVVEGFAEVLGEEVGGEGAKAIPEAAFDLLTSLTTLTSSHLPIVWPARAFSAAERAVS